MDQTPNNKHNYPSKEPAYVKAYSKQYYQKNKQRIDKLNMDEYRRNPDKWKAYQREYQKQRYAQNKQYTTCELCNKTLFITSMRNHLETKGHKANEEQKSI